jgi:hypothetical protein
LNVKFKFRAGEKPPTIKKWVAYSISTAIAVGLIVHFGNRILAYKHADLARDIVCAASKVLPDGQLARLLASLCRTSQDGKISEDEARIILGRTQQLTGKGARLFDNDRHNTDLRARDEVDYAVERWERLNPSPKIDSKLRDEHPDLTESQLCVLSQAERYEEPDGIIGIRYAGMSVCE